MKSDIVNLLAISQYSYKDVLALYYVSPKNNIGYVEMVSKETLTSAMILWRW